MGIVVIHGAGPGSGKPNVVARQWHDALVSGLRAAGLTNSEEQDIRLAFFGDLGRDGPPAANARPTDLQLAIAHEVLANGGVDERMEWERLADLVIRLHDVVGADEHLLTRFLADVDAYFGNPDVRERALEAARSACLESPGPTVLLGHGIGAVVAYDLLATDESEALHVESLLTFGSPLGMSSIRKRVEWTHPRTPFPTGLHRWIDVATELDFGTVEGKVAKLYRAQDGRRVESIVIPMLESDRGTAHDPQTYLVSAVFAEAVLDLLFPQAGGRAPELEPAVGREEASEPVRSIAVGSSPAPTRAADVPIAGTRVVERTASADFPPVVAPGSTHELLVAVAGLAIHARAEALLPFVVPVDQHEVTLKVGVYAADFEVRAVDDSRRTWAEMTIDLDDADHVAEARFKLTAHEGDEQRESPIYISFYRGNLPVGQLSLVCSIDPLHDIRRAPISVTIGGASDPEYVLVVTDRSQGLKGAGPFDIFVSKEGEYLNKPLGSFPVAVDAWEYARARLDGFRRVREEPTTKDRIRAAEDLGIELWRDLPEDFKRFYWDELHEHPGDSLAIYSQEPYIPWELIKPQREVGGEEDGFLGATMRIARWKQAVRFPDPLTVTGFSVIAPVYGPESGSRPLPGAQAEAQQLIDEFGAETVSGERAVVREMLESSKGIQLIHFAGHGDFDPDAAEISVIRLADSALVPRDLSRARLGQTAHPFVFLNACEVGEQGWALTKIGGWAEAFTDIGFSGFIGPYWAVNDRIARKSSLLFYRSLSAGLTVGEAVRQIRLQFYADPDDAGHPSWLAYTLHCQPNIHIQMPLPAVATTGTSAPASEPTREEKTDD
jgi:CHAT domain